MSGYVVDHRAPNSGSRTPCDTCGEPTGEHLQNIVDWAYYRIAKLEKQVEALTDACSEAGVDVDKVMELI